MKSDEVYIKMVYHEFLNNGDRYGGVTKNINRNNHSKGIVELPLGLVLAVLYSKKYTNCEICCIFTEKRIS